MKKKTADAGKAHGAHRVAETDLLPRYSLRGSKPSPYAARLRSAMVAVTLDADVAAVFPNAKAVNRALRGLIAATGAGKRAPRNRKAS